MSDAPRPGLLARAQAAWTMLRGGSAPAWFGPSQPLAPQAPPETAGRRYDYPLSINLQSRPRADEEIDFPALRALADNYDLLRLCIETRKDQLCALNWSIQPRKGYTADKDRIRAATEFLEMPDQEHDWDQWTRELLEDMLVLDAATIYPRRTIGGALYSLEVIDGATIKRNIDDWGRTPLLPDPAYQQILHGVPANDYRADQLIYAVRNPRPHKLYGMSPVEQIVLSVNIGLRRALHKLNYYTEGTVPDALCGVPDNWTVDMIREWQGYFDNLLTDNSAEKRRVRFVPTAFAKAFIQTKPEVLKDEFDEWLARITCYALNVTNQWAVKQMNRSTAETAQDQAAQEGAVPTQRWVRSVVNRCLRGPMGYPDLELHWDEEQQPDPKEEAETARTYVSIGAMLLNEVRDRIGLPPVPGGDVPMVITASGVIPLAQALAPPAPQGGPTDAGDEEAAQDGSQGAARAGSEDAGTEQEADPEDMAKRAPPEARLAGTWQNWLQTEAPVISRLLVRLLPADASMAKAAGSDGGDDVAGRQAAAEASGGDLSSPGALPGQPGATAGTGDPIADAIAAAVGSADWSEIEALTAPALRESAQQGIAAGIAQIQPMTAGIAARGGRLADAAIDATKLANPRAVAYADAHAADLVSGVEDATRNMLRSTIARAQDEGWSTQRLQGEIEHSAAFSPERAQLIARNELKRSSTQGNVLGWKAMQERLGLKVKKRVILGPNENHCAVCLACVAEGAIAVDDEFVAGDAPPFHPRCECSLVPVVDLSQAAPIGGTDVLEPMAKAADQPRDAHGRWTSGGFSAAAEEQHGRAAMDRVLRDKVDVHGAMNAPGLGPVSFISGVAGRGQKFKGGYGVEHIVAKRNAMGHDGEAVARAMPTVIAHGTYGTPRGPAGAQRVVVKHGEHTAVLSQGHDGSHWLLTGWK